MKKSFMGRIVFSLFALLFAYTVNAHAVDNYTDDGFFNYHQSVDKGIVFDGMATSTPEVSDDCMAATDCQSDSQNDINYKSYITETLELNEGSCITYAIDDLEQKSTSIAKSCLGGKDEVGWQGKIFTV